MEPKINVEELKNFVEAQAKEISDLRIEVKNLKDLISASLNNEQVVKVPYWLENETAQLPVRKREGDAGYDAYANETITVDPNTAAKVSCGLGMAIPEGFAVQNVNRGGNSLGKTYGQPIWVSDAFIDSNYRGICNFLLVNLGTEPITINQGDRVASITLVKTYKFDFEEIHDYCERTGRDYDEIMNTNRGESGFGSSGLK